MKQTKRICAALLALTLSFSSAVTSPWMFTAGADEAVISENEDRAESGQESMSTSEGVLESAPESELADAPEEMPENELEGGPASEAAGASEGAAESAFERAPEHAAESESESAPEHAAESESDSAPESEAESELGSELESEFESELAAYDYAQVEIRSASDALDMISFLNDYEALEDGSLLLQTYSASEPDYDPDYDLDAYASMRLVVLADDLKDTAGAIDVICYDKYDEYVLQFASAYETALGYEILSEFYDEDHLMVDELIDPSEIQPEGMENASTAFAEAGDESFEISPEVSGTNNNWGADYMGLYTILSNTDQEGLNPVTIAYVDTGLMPSLAEAYPGRVSADSYDFVEDVQQLKDTNGHGTFGASEILDATPDCVTILAIRMYSGGSGDKTMSATKIANMLLYAKDHGATVFNMSWTFGSYSRIITNTALIPLSEADISMICASGNYVSNVSSYFPANSEYTVSVSALAKDHTDWRDGISFASSFSNFGELIDFCAPGVSVRGFGSSGLYNGSGTSYASPLVCAAFAWIRATHASYTHGEVYDYACEHTIDLGDPGRDAYYGNGCICFSETYPLTSLKMSQTSWNCIAEDTLQLSTSYQPNNATDPPDEISWYSSDNSVARVSEDGLVTAVTAGECTITASGGGKNATCTVYVLGVTGLELDQHEAELMESQVMTLNVTVLPEDLQAWPDLTWSSGDESVATVDDEGMVTAVGRGQTYISVSCSGGYEAICTITVLPKLRSISLNMTEMEVMVGDTIELKISYTPEDAANITEAQWESSDSGALSVDENGFVTVLDEGIAIISVTVGSCTDYCILTAYAKETYLIRNFVRQLYRNCLDRDPDTAGLDSWVNKLSSGSSTGIKAAYGFIFSTEFKAKNLCNEDFVKVLYKAFLGRTPDAAGLASWVSKLDKGMTREEVFNGFACSDEFAAFCSAAGISRGSKISVPAIGTVPAGPCSVCGKADSVTAFVSRLYEQVLGRKADAAGLANWTTKLRSKMTTGSEVAYGFFFSAELTKKNLSNEDFVELLYNVILGRKSDPIGKLGWVAQLNLGKSRKSVFNGFAQSKEFAAICASYGILP